MIRSIPFPLNWPDFVHSRKIRAMNANLTPASVVAAIVPSAAVAAAATPAIFAVATSTATTSSVVKKLMEKAL